VRPTTAGFLAHVGASAGLRAVADEVVQVLRVMDGLNRYRFMNDAELLAAWDSASNVLATPRTGTGGKPAPGARSGRPREPEPVAPERQDVNRRR
jgi:hypothetical protein